MTQEERLARINELDKELKECIFEKTKRLPKQEFYNKSKELDNLTIEYNKANHIYWEQGEWINKVIDKMQNNIDKTGNELNNYIVNELNKLNGILVKVENNNYHIKVNTPYKVYIYAINRGYDKKCKLTSLGSQPNTMTPSNDIYEHLAKVQKLMTWKEINIEEFKKGYLPKNY